MPNTSYWNNTSMVHARTYTGSTYYFFGSPSMVKGGKYLMNTHWCISFNLSNWKQKNYSIIGNAKRSSDTRRKIHIPSQKTNQEASLLPSFPLQGSEIISRTLRFWYQFSYAAQEIWYPISTYPTSTLISGTNPSPLLRSILVRFVGDLISFFYRAITSSRSPHHPKALT